MNDKANELIFELLREKLAMPDATVREDAVTDFTTLFGEKAVPLLAGRAEIEEAWEVRRRIATALGTYGGDVALKALAEMACDDAEIVRATAAEELIKLGGQEALRPLKRILRQDLSIDASLHVIRRLRERGDEFAVALLKEALERGRTFDIHKEAVYALAEVGSESAYEALFPVFENERTDERLCLHIEKALAANRKEAMLKPLIAMFCSSDKVVGKRAKRVLEEMFEFAVVEMMHAAKGQKDIEVRKRMGRFIAKTNAKMKERGVDGRKEFGIVEGRMDFPTDPQMRRTALERMERRALPSNGQNVRNTVKQ